jgi:hypothetical protein
MRSTWLAPIAALVFSALASAQGSVRLVGGGCPNRTPPVVRGPLTIGSTMTLETGCTATPSSSKFLLIGMALPSSSWVTLQLPTWIGGNELCDVSVIPVIIGADVTNAPDPLPIRIPNDPIWSGFPLGLQSYCIECGFAGCFAALTPGIEVTIR